MTPLEILFVFMVGFTIGLLLELIIRGINHVVKERARKKRLELKRLIWQGIKVYHEALEESLEDEE